LKCWLSVGKIGGGCYGEWCIRFRSRSCRDIQKTWDIDEGGFIFGAWNDRILNAKKAQRREDRWSYGRNRKCKV
jgi:hypothetical protein